MKFVCDTQRAPLIALAIGFCLATPALAGAQEAVNTAETAPEASEGPMDEPAQPTVVEPGPREEEIPAFAEPAEAGARFRWGISALGGPMLGGVDGGVGGIDARFGAQINKDFGIYGQPLFLVGVGASISRDGSSANASGLALVGVGALADATFGDLFYLAGGPALLYGGIAEGTSNVDGNTSSGQGGGFFAIATRAGFAFGSMRPERRRAFTVGLDMHVIFAYDVVVTPLLALGYESF